MGKPAVSLIRFLLRHRADVSNMHLYVAMFARTNGSQLSSFQEPTRQAAFSHATDDYRVPSLCRPCASRIGRFVTTCPLIFAPCRLSFVGQPRMFRLLVACRSAHSAGLAGKGSIVLYDAAFA